MQERLKIAIEAVKQAGARIMELRTSGFEKAFKSDKSPVTDADRAAEQLIRDLLLSHFPEDGFVGEELGVVSSQSGLTWACDPIDGTWSFINLENTFTISLGLLRDKVPVLAVIHNPLTGEWYTGAEGILSLYNGMPMPVVQKYTFHEGVINFFIHRSQLGPVALLYQMRNDNKISKLVSQGGSLASALAQIARGCNNVFIGLSNKRSGIWDVAAGLYLIRSVGGRITLLSGEPVELTLPPFTTMIASTNALIHEDALRVLQESGFSDQVS
ncbi:MAG: inositol monophosphatase [Bacteroidota bacterium]